MSKFHIICKTRNVCTFYIIFFSLFFTAWISPVKAQQNLKKEVISEQEQIIAFIHPVASRARIVVNGLTIWESDMVFGVWVYQINLTSWLDTEPSNVQIQIHLGNADQAYAKAELRLVSGNPDDATVLQQVSFNADDTEGTSWNKYNTLIEYELSRAQDSVHPIWIDPSDFDLGDIQRSHSVDLVREVQNCIQTCNTTDLMPLITPALTNQAMMGGVSPDVLIRTMETFVKRLCIRNIKIAETRQNYYSTTYKNIMAPINFDDLRYNFAETDQGERRNLFTPADTIEYKTHDNRKFKIRLFLSYTDENRNRRFISRFFFDRTE